MPDTSRIRPTVALRVVALWGGMALAACDMPQAPPVQTAPQASVRPAPRAEIWSPDSLALHEYYKGIENERRAQGLLRTDGGGPDTPFSDAMLVENFIRAALYDEYRVAGDRVVARETPSRLRRWEEPVRMRLEFGQRVPQPVRAKDREDVAAYAARLSRLTGHPVSMTENDDANFHVLVLTEAERRAIGPRLKELVDGIDPVSVQTITNMPREAFCLVIAFSRGESSVYSDAVAVIRAEHPDLTRLSCYHEELAQGMGLPNDNPHARPSIFNDVMEFALLTTHDELLLRMLYDSRLRPGMDERTARPIVNTIVSELLGGEA